MMRLPHLEDGSNDMPQICGMVDLFMAAGGTYFDTAYVYGGVRNRRNRGGLRLPWHRVREQGQFRQLLVQGGIIAFGVSRRDDGVRCQHIIDAGTGYPSTSDIVSATVVSCSALAVDMLTAKACPLDSNGFQELGACHLTCCFVIITDDSGFLRGGSCGHSSVQDTVKKMLTK